MHDPDTMVFTIRRPWPRPDPMATQDAKRTGRRWRIGHAFWTIAGRGYYWPHLIVIWHRDPSGYDAVSCRIDRDRRWRLHVHHWRIQVPPLQALRRRLLTRCEVCGGRSTRGNEVDFSQQWDSPRSPWWRGEKGLRHMSCRTKTRA